MTNKNRKTPLRSKDWFDNRDNPGMTALYVERYLNFGITREELQSGRPIIGIAQTGSDLSPCNRIHVDLADRVKAGIRAKGGVPLEFPVHPIQETGRRPTAALDRNLAYLGLVEILHGYPLDGVILTTGCDKTTPACIMAAATADIPAIVLSGGPMLDGHWQGRLVGSGTIVWEAREMLASKEIDYDAFMDMVTASAPSLGHCNTMGTALSMNSLAEALGMSLPGCASIPAPYRERGQMAYATGERIVDMVWEDLTPSKIMTAQAMENAIRVDMAIGGSTNAIIHLKAIAGRLGLDFPLEKFDEISRTTPVLANISPSGKYLMEDFYYAGGLPALMKEILDLLHGDIITATGKTLAENLKDAECYNPEVILPRDKPLQASGGTIILRGNICPNGAVLKTSAADPKLLQHTGRAVVFENHDDLLARGDSPDLDIDENCVMVLKNSGPHGGPGMPELGNMPIPAKLIKKGITDILRISDARMSGTSYGACVLHIAPESAIGGPLAAIQDGDQIRLDVEKRTLDVLIDEHEMNRRLQLLELPEPAYERGWGKIFLDNVLQADEGCDFAVLKGKGSKTEPSLPF